MNEQARRRILVVEDVLIIALDIEAILSGKGYDVAGPAPDLQTAFQIVEKEALDAAVLDVNLQGELTFPLARKLQERGIPFLFLTGYDGEHGALKEFKDTTRLEKPIDEEQLLRIVSGLFPNSHATAVG
jgi:CheY-like chemotaxis protein